MLYFCINLLNIKIKKTKFGPLLKHITHDENLFWIHKIITFYY